MKARITRRGFLAGAARGLGLGLAVPYVVGSQAFGANERLGIGHIGVGGMGGHHLGRFAQSDDCPTLAISDVDESHRINAGKRCKREVGLYNDFRRLLDRQDIDAVVVAPPDHWHGLHTVYACEAGKDVYCEKPMMKTIQEGQAMVAAARKYGRVVQIGTQGRSSSHTRHTAQYVRNGYCGKVKYVETWHPENPSTGWEPPREPPAGLDWDLWLGPAKYVPYSPKRCHFSFRWFMDFGGGNIRDRGAHIFSCIFWAMDADQTGPVSIEATGTLPEGMFDTPTKMDVKYEFEKPDWTLRWLQPGTAYGDWGFGMKFFGSKDDVVLCGGDGGVRAEEKVFFEAPAGQQRLYVSNDHMGDFLNCVRTRQRPIMDVARGHRVTSLCILGNIAFRVGRKLRWDPVNEQVIGDPEANRMVAVPCRPPWRV